MSTLKIIALFACGAIVSYLAGTRQSGKPDVAQAASVHGILYYHDPMHPGYKSDKPGVAPDCGMQLEPVYSGDSESAGKQAPDAGGVVPVTSTKQQSIGLVVEQVRRESPHHTFHLLGRVGVDETAVIRMAVPVEGLVRQVAPVVPGSIVEQGALLATFYNRDFLTAQQTYLYALDTMDRLKGPENVEQLKLTKAQIQAAEENLEFLGMGQAQCREIARTRQIAKDIHLRAPGEGLLLARNVFPGLRFERGTELFRIANLSRVWVYADVFENEAALLGSVKAATVRYQRRSFPARFGNAPPQFDGATRVLKMRLELDNPGFVLRPDMFVDVDLALALPACIAVPADAVIDSGLRKTVYVEREPGVFEPRPVETGWRMGDRVEVTQGLAAGERIVVSGNFLLDSESRMKLTAAAAHASFGKDPACGMEIDPSKAAARSENSGKTYFFCSSSCREKFDREPEKYLGSEAGRHAGARHD